MNNIDLSRLAARDIDVVKILVQYLKEKNAEIERILSLCDIDPFFDENGAAICFPPTNARIGQLVTMVPIMIERS